MIAASPARSTMRRVASSRVNWPSASAATGRREAPGRQTHRRRPRAPCRRRHPPTRRSRVESRSRRKSAAPRGPSAPEAAFHSPASPRMLTTISTGDLIRQQQRGGARSANFRGPLGLEHHGRQAAAKVQTGRNAEGLLLARGQQQPHVIVLLGERRAARARADCPARTRRRGCRRPWTPAQTSDAHRGAVIPRPGSAPIAATGRRPRPA